MFGKEPTSKMRMTSPTCDNANAQVVFPACNTKQGLP